MANRKKIKLVLVAGARPNFMKIAPLVHVFSDQALFEPVLVHTGQHYDEKMSNLFFKQLDIPAPQVNLEVGSASHAVQTARIMEGFERVCLDIKPDLVMVVGDVNSTVACTLVASKMGIKTVHYEAGLRSNDRSMPEEINRLVTDSISDYFFTTSYDADQNLLREGVDAAKIHMVGNLMIDTLVKNLQNIDGSQLTLSLLNRPQQVVMGTNLQKGNYGVMTFHRPSNVDDRKQLTALVDIWVEVSNKVPLVFPIHPRTYKNIHDFSLADKINRAENIYLTDSLGYFEFIALVSSAMFALTDSGGIQEETTFLNVPCLTVRPNTERPITILEGSNKLITIADIGPEIELILTGKGKKGKVPKFWDGRTAKRISDILLSFIQRGEIVY